MAAESSKKSIKCYPNLKIQLSSSSNKRKVSFLHEEPKKDTKVNLRMTIQIPPTKKRKFAPENGPAAVAKAVEAEYEEDEEEDDDLDDNHNHKREHRKQHTNDSHLSNEINDDDSVEHEVEPEDINVSIQKAIKIIQQTQEHHLAAFQQLLQANGGSEEVGKKDKKTTVKSRMTRNHKQPKPVPAEPQKPKDLTYIEPTDNINDVTFKVTL